MKPPVNNKGLRLLETHKGQISNGAANKPIIRENTKNNVGSNLITKVDVSTNGKVITISIMLKILLTTLLIFII